MSGLGITVKGPRFAVAAVWSGDLAITATQCAWPGMALQGLILSLEVFHSSSEM